MNPTTTKVLFNLHVPLKKVFEQIPVLGDVSFARNVRKVEDDTIKLLSFKLLAGINPCSINAK